MSQKVFLKNQVFLFLWPQIFQKTPCALTRSIYFALFQIAPIADNSKWGKEPIFSKLMKRSPQDILLSYYKVFFYQYFLWDPTIFVVVPGPLFVVVGRASFLDAHCQKH